MISRETFLKWRLERGGLCPAEDAGNVALGLLIAPGVFLGRLLVPAAWVRHGSIHLRVGLGWALLRALLLLLWLLWRGRGIWLLQLLGLLLVVTAIPADVVVVVKAAAIVVLVGLTPASSTATTTTPGAAPATASRGVLLAVLS